MPWRNGITRSPEDYCNLRHDISHSFPAGIELRVHCKALFEKVDHDAGLLRYEAARGIDRVDRLGLGFIAVQQHHQTAGLDLVGQMPDRRIADAEARQESLAYAFRIARSHPAFDLDTDRSLGTSKIPAHSGADSGKGYPILLA